MRGFFYALTFLSRIRLPFRVVGDDSLPRRSVKYFSLVGLIIGLLLVLVDQVVAYLLPPAAASAIVMAVLVYLSGGLHLEGLMDTVDGLYSGREREQALEIMHDSRVGAFGVIALVLILLIKWQFLVGLSGPERTAALMLMPVVGRWLMVYAAYSYPIAGSSYLARQFFADTGIGVVFIGLLPPVGIIVFLHYWMDLPLLLGAMVILVSWLITVLLASRISRRLGGLTGDIYGMVNELVEVVVLFIFLLKLG